MKFETRRILGAALVFAAFAAPAGAQTLTAGWTTVTTLEQFPANDARAVNPDVQLRLTFDRPPVIGTSGKIRIYDAANDRLVDTLDMSIPPGPTERAAGDALTAPYLSKPYPYARTARATNATTKPGTPSAGARPTPETYQLTIIGGFTDGFHFYPVIVDGNTATIQLHHDLLQYGKTYYVESDAAVLSVPGGSFKGISGKQAWRFSTKQESQAPKSTTTRVIVSRDGTGDFNTVQGAMDFVPDHSKTRITIDVREGVYPEIVYFRNKENVSIVGAGPGKTIVRYANNEVLNPHPVNIRTNELPGTFPSRRAAFTVDNSDDIHIVNMTLETTSPGQAEGLLMTGARNILSHVAVIGAGDALQVNGPAYIVDSTVLGTGDTILGRGPAFFERCTITSTRVFMWIRNTNENHGNVFKDCSFVATDVPMTLARSPQNNVSTYPYAEAVLLNCTLTNIAPEGWGAADTGGNVHFWEFNSRNPDGSLVDISRRAPISRQLDRVKDAKLISDYGSPAFVLGGWKPELAAPK